MFRLIRFAIFMCISSAWLVAQTPAAKPAAASTPQARSAADTNAEFAEARRLAQQGKYDEAIDKLQALATKNPKPAGVSHELGLAYYKKADYLKAAEYLKQAAAENPDDKEAVQLLGLSYYLAGRPADAVPYLEKVQTWYPHANVDASYVLGTSYIQTRDYPNARKAFATMFDVPPESGAAYLVTARMLFRQEFLPSLRSTPRKPLRLIRSSRLHTNCWAKCTCTCRKFLTPSVIFSRSLLSIPRIPLCITNSVTPTLECKNMTTHSGNCSARSGWTQARPGHTS